MAYSKQTWNNGDVITKAKLDHIESGIFSVDQSVPNSASIIGNGILTFKHGNLVLFQVQLPLYNGGVS